MVKKVQIPEIEVVTDADGNLSLRLPNLDADIKTRILELLGQGQDPKPPLDVGLVFDPPVCDDKGAILLVRCKEWDRPPS